jgi:hypothetical protein
MNYLLNYYKNICEKYQQKIIILQNYLNEVAESGINVAGGGLAQEPIPQEGAPIGIPDMQGPRDPSIPPSPIDYFYWCEDAGCDINTPPGIGFYDKDGDGKISPEERQEWNIDTERWHQQKNLYTRHFKEHSKWKSSQKRRRVSSMATDSQYYS